MTDVGSVSVGVDVNGGDLGEKLAATIRAAVLPAIEQVNRELAATNRQIKDLDSGGFEKIVGTARAAAAGVHDMRDEAEKAATALDRINSGEMRKLAQAARTAATAVKDVGQNATKAAALTSAAADKMVRDYNRVGDAADRAAQRQIEAATAVAAANEAASRAGGGGSGGGGGGRGGRGGGGLTSGFSGAAIFNAGALAIGNIPAVTTAVVNLAGAVQTLAQAGGVIPGIYAGVGASLGTAVIGFHGMSDAVTALNKAAASGDPKDLQKATEALKDLAPAAVDTAKAVSTFINGPWKDLQKSTAQTMFDGVDKTLNDLATTTMPTLTRGTAEVGSAWNKTFKELGRVGGLDSTQSFLDKIFGNTADAQTRANAAIAPLVHGIGTLTSESTDFLPRLADGVTKLSTRFDNFITKSVGNGNFDKWINQGIEGADHLGTTILNVGKIITDITKAAGGDGGLLNVLDKGSTALSNFLGSDQGQAKLSAFFADGRQQLAQWLPILQNLGPVLMDVYQASRQWSDLLMPFLRDALGLLDRFPGVVQTAVLAFLAFKTISPFTKLLGDLQLVNGLFDDLAKKKIPGTPGLSTLGQQATSIPGVALAADAGVVAYNAGKYVDRGGSVLDGRTGNNPDRPAGRDPFGENDKPTPLVQQAAQGIKNVVAGTGIDEANAKLKAAQEAAQRLSQTIASFPPGNVDIKSNAPDVLDNIAKLRELIRNIPPGHAEILVTYNVQGAPIGLDQLRAPQRAPDSPKFGGGRASGGVFPGYAPGIDSLWARVSPGEGVLIPEAVRALGGAKGIFGINSMFRSGLSRLGYRAGGIVPGDPASGEGLGPLPGPGVPGDNSVTGLLTQIRDLLAGRGSSDAPLKKLGATAGSASGLTGAARVAGSGATGPIGPFGTPLKVSANPGYDAAAAAIQALGGDPEKVIGIDPSTYFGTGGVGAAATARVPGNPAMYTAALAAFAQTGNLGGDLTGLGLDANDPVIRAITTARNKKKGGLGGDAIAGLVDQVVGGPGYTGTLDSSNSSLIAALQTFNEKVAAGKIGSQLAAPGVAGAGVAPGGQVPLTGNANALIAFAQSANGGKYAPASDLTHGLADCSGAVSDLVELLTQGQTTPARLFTTTNEEQVLQGLGATPGFVPGNLNIGFNAGHTAATLPNGANFESGGSGGGVVYGGPVGALDKQFTKVYSLPTDMAGVNLPGLGAGATAPGLPGANIATSGAPIPVFVVNGMPGGGGVPGAPGVPGGIPGVPGSAFAGTGAAAGPGGATNYPGKSVVDAATAAVGNSANDVLGSLIDAVLSATDHKIGAPTAPSTSLSQLLKEGNPNALAAAFGANVPDYTRQGGQGEVAQQGPEFDAKGRMFSDSGALIDRSFTDLQAQQKAFHDQEMAVLDQIKDNLGKDALKPVLQAGVTAGVNGLSDAITSQIGTQMGQSAGPVIADAVHSAVATVAASAAASSSSGAAPAGGLPLFDEGGLWATGTVAANMSGSVERVLDPVQTRLFDAGMLGGWNTQPLQQHRAAADGVDVTDTVGADFFGVSQIPIIGTIVNLLVSVLLKLIGVQITARNTLTDMSSDVRQFRGTFDKFDATGRLLNDTSGILDRSSTSEQEAADERVRILKLVIEGLIKFIIDKVVIPIGQAVANAAISAGAGAAGSALNTVAPGAGGIVSGFISSAGQAGVAIAGQLATTFTDAATPVVVDGITNLIQSLFPGLTTKLFGGGNHQQKVAPPLQNLGGPIAGGLAGLFAALVGGATFDDGGVASGMGLMPKATIEPERVLSPGMTPIFDRFVTAMENGGRSGGSTVTLHAPITVVGGGEQAANNAHAKLLSLLGGA